VSARSNALILGAQRSGKSRYAEEVVLASGRNPIYIATATAGDDEMRRRIAAHRARRDGRWRTVEEALDLPGAIDRIAREGNAVVVDCLTLWLSNLMEAERSVESEAERLLAALDGAAAPVVLVSNEVGAGIIPANALARRFVDAQGVLNMRVAAAVGTVVLMTAGLPVIVKPTVSAPLSI
jgi:adenosylcobinamide kinase/adenosylcobinamide-phosphate guanylyltransferase